MISLREFDLTMVSNRKIDRIENRILLVRGERVMLDSDLAVCYGVTTKQLNQQLKRNRNRFPDDFAFRLTAQEVTNLRSQFVTSSLEIGFHVREKSRRYRTTRKRNIEGRTDG
jgi:hypothetical protein